MSNFEPGGHGIPRPQGVIPWPSMTGDKTRRSPRLPSGENASEGNDPTPRKRVTRRRLLPVAFITQISPPRVLYAILPSLDEVPMGQRFISVEVRENDPAVGELQARLAHGRCVQAEHADIAAEARCLQNACSLGDSSACGKETSRLRLPILGPAGWHGRAYCSAACAELEKARQKRRMACCFLAVTSSATFAQPLSPEAGSS